MLLVSNLLKVLEFVENELDKTFEERFLKYPFLDPILLGLKVNFQKPVTKNLENVFKILITKVFKVF